MEASMGSPVRADSSGEDGAPDPGWRGEPRPPSTRACAPGSAPSVGKAERPRVASSVVDDSRDRARQPAVRTTIEHTNQALIAAARYHLRGSAADDVVLFRCTP